MANVKIKLYSRLVLFIRELNFNSVLYACILWEGIFFEFCFPKSIL